MANSLPIPPDKARAIREHREKVRYQFVRDRVQKRVDDRCRSLLHAPAIPITLAAFTAGFCVASILGGIR